jgi:hypothetical protein
MLAAPAHADGWTYQVSTSAGMSMLADKPYQTMGLSLARSLPGGFDVRAMGHLLRTDPARSSPPQGWMADMDLLWSPRQNWPSLYPYTGVGGRALLSSGDSGAKLAFSAGLLLGVNLFGWLYAEGRYGLVKLATDPTRAWEVRAGIAYPIGGD